MLELTHAVHDAGQCQAHAHGEQPADRMSPLYTACTLLLPRMLRGACHFPLHEAYLGIIINIPGGAIDL